AGHVAADRFAHGTVRAVATDDVSGVNGAFGPVIVTGGSAQLDGHRVVAVADCQIDERPAVVRRNAGRSVGRALGEVVEHPGLVDDQMGEFAYVLRFVGGARRAHDVGGVVRVGIPAVHRRDVVSLGDDGFGETE